VDERVVDHLVLELRELVGGRELAEQEQERRLEVRALDGELVDRVAAVAEDPRVAVDVGDRASDRRGVEERGVVAHEAEVVLVDGDLPEGVRPDRAVLDRHLVRAAGPVVGDGQRVGHGEASFERPWWYPERSAV